MLRLRRATVVEAGPQGAPEQDLAVEIEGVRRPAIADVGLVGAAEAGDEVIVNTQALDLGLGSGGFDVVHANLTRGLAGQARPLEWRAGGGETDRGEAAVTTIGMPAAEGDRGEGARVMKLNYTSLQHAVKAVDEGEWRLRVPPGRPVGVLALHGQLAPVVWAFARAAEGARLGYVQTGGGALPGARSRTVRALRERGLLAGHITAGPAFGGEREAVTTAGALQYGLDALGWDAAVCGPGPGIVGSGSRLGHGGLAALDSAHAGLALGCTAVVAARMSSGDPRARHRGMSHHTLTVLDLLLAPVTVALPAGVRSPVGADVRAGLQGDLRGARIARHDWRRTAVDLPGYAASGLPAQTMGRGLAQDSLFFAAALAAGTVLAELAMQPAKSGIAHGPVRERRGTESRRNERRRNERRGAEWAGAQAGDAKVRM